MVAGMRAWRVVALQCLWVLATVTTGAVIHPGWGVLGMLPLKAAAAGNLICQW